jgi:hypothetical protein
MHLNLIQDWNKSWFLIQQIKNQLISGFQHASLLSVTFINQLMHSIITVIVVKILLYRSLKDTH